MKKISLKSLPLVLSALCGCTPEFDFGSIDFEPQIVVEGWIENGGVANVCLTQALTMDMDTAGTSISDIAIRWAKVTVSDGQTEEVLTGRVDKNYMPPFIYRGSRIKGETGKTYWLKVEYSGRVLTASTTIPPVTPIEKLTVSKCTDSDTLYQIELKFHDDPLQQNYYKIFTQVIPEDTRFYPAFMGTFADNVLEDNTGSVRANRAMRHSHIGKYTPFFSLNDTVNVKLTQLPEEGFEFWSGYENEIINGKNPIFPSSTNLSTNIQGGKGIWCGYGKVIRRVTIADSIR